MYQLLFSPASYADYTFVEKNPMHLIRKHHSFCIIFFIKNPSRRMLYNSFQHNIVVLLLLIPYAWLKVVLFPEKVATTANQICRISVPISLRRIIFSLLYASPAARYMGSTRHYIEFEYDSFGLGCVLTSINGSINVHMVG